MKKIFDITAVIGFIFLVIGAGGYETMSATFSQSLVIMLSGVSLMALSAYAKDKYVKHMRKLSRMRKRKDPVQLQSEKMFREVA